MANPDHRSSLHANGSHALSDSRPRRAEEARRLQRVIGYRLTLARADAGLTQPQVAARLGRPRSFVSDVERGQRGIQLGEIRRLLEIYAAEAPGAVPTFEAIVNPTITSDEEWVARGENAPARGNPRWRDRAP